MSTLLSLLAVISLVCMCLALWRPERFYPFREPTWIKAVGFYFAMAVALFILSSSLDPSDGPDGRIDEIARPAASGPLTWKEIGTETVAMPLNGRDRVILTIAPVEAQARAKQKELVETVKSVAIKTQKESGAPVVIVNLLSQETESAMAAPLLAQAVYIPDGKGYDGDSSAADQWESINAAPRGFSQEELTYMALWAELHRGYQSAVGVREKELDAAVSARMDVPAGSLTPFTNKMERIGE